MIRRNTGRLANEAITSNPIVSSKQFLSGLKLNNWYGCIWWLFRSKDCEALSCSFQLSSIVFICFSKAFSRGEKVNLASCMILFCFGCNIFSPVRHSYLYYLMMMQISLLSSFLCHVVLFHLWLYLNGYSTVFCTSYNRFFQKRNGLSDGRVVSMTKNEYGSAVDFLYSSIRSLKLISNEWSITISWPSHFMMKKYPVFSLRSFGTLKY